MILLAIVATTPVEAREHHRADLTTSDSYALPNPLLTPGGIDPNATLAVICNTTTKQRRNVTPATRAKVLRDYNQPSVTTDDYELDHLIPLCLGGNNSAANLWPQPAPDYHIKDELEFTLCSYVCLRKATLEQAQREIADDWVGAVRRYLGR